VRRLFTRFCDQLKAAGVEVRGARDSWHRAVGPCRERKVGTLIASI
jgi:hypothetical protein